MVNLGIIARRNRQSSSSRVIKTALIAGWFDCRLDSGICQTIPNCIDNDAAVGIGLDNYTYGHEPPMGFEPMTWRLRNVCSAS